MGGSTGGEFQTKKTVKTKRHYGHGVNYKPFNVLKPSSSVEGMTEDNGAESDHELECRGEDFSFVL